MAAKQKQDAQDVAVAVCHAARKSGWRVCARCGGLSVPPGARVPCIDCTRFTLTPKKARPFPRHEVRPN